MVLLARSALACLLDVLVVLLNAARRYNYRMSTALAAEMLVSSLRIIALSFVAGMIFYYLAAISKEGVLFCKLWLTLTLAGLFSDAGFQVCGCGWLHGCTCCNTPLLPPTPTRAAQSHGVRWWQTVWRLYVVVVVAVTRWLSWLTQSCFARRWHSCVMVTVVAAMVVVGAHTGNGVSHTRVAING